VSTTAIGPLSNAVHDELQAANIEDMVPGISVFGFPPDLTPPFVRWGEKSEKPLETLSKHGVQCSIVIEMASAALTDSELLDIYALVKGTLDDQNFGVVGFTVVQKSVSLEKTSMDPDGSAWRGFARLDAVLQA
jgi:hypothetical protein